MKNLWLLFCVLLLLNSCNTPTTPSPTTPTPTTPNTPDYASAIIGTWVGADTSGSFSSSLTISSISKCLKISLKDDFYCTASGSISFTYPGKTQCDINYTFDDGYLGILQATADYSTLEFYRQTPDLFSSFKVNFFESFSKVSASARNSFKTLETCNVGSSGEYTLTKQ